MDFSIDWQYSIKIDSYSFGNIVIDGKNYSSDVIILKDKGI